MSIESEMSHQRFRFLLQSGVWHLFPTLSFIVCLVQHEMSPKCMIMHPCSFTRMFSKTHWVTCLIVPVLPFLFLPVIASPFFLHSSLSSSVQHSNPGHAGPFPVASLHNANPTSPTSASMAGAHAHRGPASPVIGPIELIPSVTNPENLPCLPEIPPIQVC